MSSDDLRILLSPPDLAAEDAGLVQDAISSNWIAPVGPDLDAFERELCDVTGAGDACALSSGTAAIHLGLKLLGVKTGDRVLCSSLTFVASANPILYCGAEPVFIDADPETWCMSLPALERTLERMSREQNLPRACVAVSLYGQSADLPKICELCGRYGVKVLDEAAEALGATHQGRMTGTFGDLGVYSFNGNKIITTSGGGALVGHDRGLIEQARFMATQARDHSAIGAYEHSTLGFNYRMSNLLAALGRGQLRRLDEKVERRRSIFERYERELSEPDRIRWMPEASYGRGTRWLSCCLVGNRAMRDKAIHHLNENGIEARPVWNPLHKQTLFTSCHFEGHGPEEDVSATLFERGLCLPSGSSLTFEQQTRVIEALREVLA